MWIRLENKEENKEDLGLQSRDSVSLHSPTTSPCSSLPAWVVTPPVMHFRNISELMYLNSNTLIDS